MIETVINKMHKLIIEMQDSIKMDIADIKAAKNEKLMERNNLKQEMMEEIVRLKEQLNNLLIEESQKGNDINEYRVYVDNLEDELRVLHKLNTKLGSIVLPLKKMYKEIVDDLTSMNGGQLLEVKV